MAGSYEGSLRQRLEEQAVTRVERRLGVQTLAAHQHYTPALRIVKLIERYAVAG
jgi:hypothetical protein